MKFILRHIIVLLVAVNSLLFAGITFSGCKKDSPIDNTRMVTDYITSQLEVNALVDMMSAVGGIGTDYRNDVGFLPSCASVTFDTLHTTKTITVNFGRHDCLCQAYDNQYRQGEVIMTWKGRLRDVGNSFNISVLNYTVNDNPHTLSIKVTSLGQGSNASYSIGYSGSDTLKFPSDNTQQIVSYTMTKQFITGYYTVSPLDNIYSLTGSTNGIGSLGTAFTTTIQTPLDVDNTCVYRLVGGITEVAPNATGAYTVNFGSGECDNIVSLTINGTYKTIQFEP